jgi:hypothetical protein
MPKRRTRARGVLSAARGAERPVEEGREPVASPTAEASPEVAGGPGEQGAFSEEEPPTQVRDVPTPNEIRAEAASSEAAAESASDQGVEAPALDAPAFTEDEPPTQVGEVAAGPSEAPAAPGPSEEAAAPVASGSVADGAVADPPFEEEPPTRPGVVWTADAEALADAPPPPRVRASAVTPAEPAEDVVARTLRSSPARPTKAARPAGPRPVIAIPESEPEPFTQAEAPTQPDGDPIDLPVEPLDALPKVPGVWAGPAWDEVAEEEEDPRPAVSEQLADVSPAVAARTRLSAAVSDGPGSTVWEVDARDRDRAGAREGRAGPRPEPIGVVFPTDPPAVDPRQIALWLGGAALVTMLGWVLFG